MKSKPIFRMALAGAILLSSTACSPPARPPGSNLDPRALQSLLADQAWINNVNFRLSANYVNDDFAPGFGDLDLSLLTQPSIYDTDGAVGIYRLIGTPIENEQAIAEWIASLRIADGSYDAPHYDLDPLYETLLAVRILSTMGMPPDDPEPTLDFIRSLIDEDGTFRWAAGVQTHNNNSKMAATVIALKTLQLLQPGFQQRFDLSSTRAALLMIVDQLLEDTSGRPEDLRTTDMAIHALSILSPAEVPASARSYLIEALSDPQHCAANLGSLSHLNSVVSAAANLEMQAEVDSAETFDGCVEDRILSGLAEQVKAVSFGAQLDTLTIRLGLELAPASSLDDGFKTALTQILGRYRIPPGWIMLVDNSPTIHSTATALEIARITGFTQYDPGNMVWYLNQVLLENINDVNLLDTYNAVQGLKTLGRSPNSVVTGDLMQRSQADLLTSSSDEIYAHDGAILCRLAEVLEHPLERKTRNLLGDLLDQLPLENERIMDLYALVVLQDCSGRELLGTNAIERKVMRLWSSGGGFRSAGLLPEADLIATYYGLAILHRIGRIEAVDYDDVISFVLSCKGPFGFHYEPVVGELTGESNRIFSENYSDLDSTLMGLEILGGFD